MERRPSSLGIRSLRTRSRAVLVALLLVSASQLGCIGVGLTMLGAGVGIGGGSAVNYTLNGYAYRTFAAPIPVVEKAALGALELMGVELESRERIEQGRLLIGSASERTVVVRLERVTDRATRVRTHVRMGILMDRATATEIIIQTEEVLAGT